MCILFISLLENRHSGYKIVILNNRDEFWERPTAPADFWHHLDSNILAGRDLVRGGTWFGVTKSGKFACLTNFRVPMHLVLPDKKSRGELPSEFLKGSMSPSEYASHVAETLEDYDGFNLIVGDLTTGDFWSVSNRDPENRHARRLESGRLYGLSNAVLDVPWPKVSRGKHLISSILSKQTLDEDQLIEELLSVLMDKNKPADSELPETGVELELERCYSSIHVEEMVRSPASHYGTRTSTLALLDHHNRLRYVERNLDTTERKWSDRSFEFVLEKSLQPSGHPAQGTT